jgi:hypothetical protein
VYLFLLWVLLRISRRVRSQVRQEKLMFEAKSEGVVRNATKKSPGIGFTH